MKRKLESDVDVADERPLKKILRESVEKQINLENNMNSKISLLIKENINLNKRLINFDFF